MRHQAQPILRFQVVDHLHRRGRQPTARQRFRRGFGQQARGAQVARVGLGDNRVSCRQRRGKITARDAVEGEGEVVGPKDHHRPAQGGKDRADIVLRIDRRHAPGTVARGSRRLAKLSGRARQLHRAQTRLCRQPRLTVRHRRQRVCTRLDRRRVSLQKDRYRFRPRGNHLRRGGFACPQRMLHLGPARNRVLLREALPRRRVHRLKKPPVP